MKKILLIPIIIVIFGFIIFIIAGTPFFLDFVKRKIEDIIQRQISTPVQIGALKGNLFYSVEIVDCNIDETVNFNRLKLSYDIFKLVSKEIHINELLLDGLRVDVNRLETLKKNIEKKEGKEIAQGEIFKVRIKRLTITNSDILGVLDNRAVNIRLDIKGQFLSDLLIIDTLSIDTGKSNIMVKGNVPLHETGELDVQYNVTLDCADLNLTGLTGTLLSKGVIQGKMSAPKIINNTTLAITYQKNKISGNFELTWQTPVLDSLYLIAIIDATISAKQKKVGRTEKMNLFLKTGASKISCDVGTSHGKLRLSGTLKGDINKPEIDVGLVGTVTFNRFKSRIKSGFVYRDNKLLLKNFNIKNHELLLKCNARINTGQTQDLNADIFIDCRDLSIVNNFVQTPLPISGAVKIAARINGTMQSPAAAGSIVLKDVNIYCEHITDAEFSFKLHNDRITLDHGKIDLTRGSVNLTGGYDIIDSTFSIHVWSEGLTLKSPEIFNGDTIPLDGTIDFDISLKGKTFNPAGKGNFSFKNISYDTLIVGDYELECSIIDSTVDISLLNDKKNFDLKAKADLFAPYAFNTTLSLEHFELSNYVPVETGFITAYASLAGKLIQPEKCVGEMHIESLYVAKEQYTIHSIDTVMIDVKESFIDIVSCAFSIQGQRVDIHGRVPLDFKRGNIKLYCKSSKIDVSAVAAVVPDFPEIKGFVYVDVAVEGGISEPDIIGELRLENIKYNMPSIMVDSVNSLITFQKNKIDIEYLRGMLNHGSFSINGFAHIGDGMIDTMSIDVSMEKIDIEHKEFGNYVFTNSMLVSAKNNSFKIDGEITVDKAIYDVPFDLQKIVKLLTTANRPSPEPGDILKRVYCDIGLSTLRGIKIANNVAQVTVDADLQIKGYLFRINVYGTVTTTEKGIITYLGKQFNIINAVIEFDDPYRINPVLNLEASTAILSEDGNYEIFMYVAGTVEKWTLELTSNPPVPEPDIISLLLIGKRRPGLGLVKGEGIDLKETARDYAMGLVRGTVERTAESKLGLEKFIITGELLDPRNLDIGIEKRFAKKWTFIYGTGIEYWELRRIGVSYDITDNLSIFTLHDQEHINSSIDLDLHFKLK